MIEFMPITTLTNDGAGGGRRSYRLGMNLAACVWGFAEATLFFVVPDVLLTWIALHDARAAWRSCVWCLAGAVVGGAVMYGWGAYDVDSALVVLDCVPGVNQAMCDTVAEQLRTRGPTALFLGPVAGTPYKVYAVHAGAIPTPVALFLLASVPARLLRFVVLAGFAVLVRRAMPRMSLTTSQILHAVVWGCFYAWSFWRAAN